MSYKTRSCLWSVEIEVEEDILLRERYHDFEVACLERPEGGDFIYLGICRRAMAER